jgi:pimeloyl-ACP methyl ester carboxylesterase
VFIRVNGIELYYEAEGGGPALLLLHGNGESHEIFDRLSAALKDSFTVYAVDSRGHGKSGRADRLSYSDLAEDCAGLIEALKLDRPAVCGFSDGGITALLLAIKRPELPGSLIVCGANTSPAAIKTPWLLLFKALHFFTRSPLLRLMLTGPDIRPEELARIRVPALVVAGGRDMIKEADTRLIAASIPGAKLKIFKGENHASYVVHSDRLAATIRDFCGAG